MILVSRPVGVLFSSQFSQVSKTEQTCQQIFQYLKKYSNVLIKVEQLCKSLLCLLIVDMWRSKGFFRHGQSRIQRKITERNQIFIIFSSCHIVKLKSVFFKSSKIFYVGEFRLQILQTNHASLGIIAVFCAFFRLSEVVVSVIGL